MDKDAVRAILARDRKEWATLSELLDSYPEQTLYSLSLTEARLKATLAFERRFDIIGAIPAERWDEQLAGIVRYDGAAHFALQRSYISVS